MQTGKETWKWGVVVLLLAIFLITANQAYQHIANQETFEPPDDYLKGDSWDLEHQSGPGAGQAMQMPTEQNPQTTPTTDASPWEQNSIEVPSQIVIEDDIDWNQSDAPAAKEEKTEAPVTPVAPATPVVAEPVAVSAEPVAEPASEAAPAVEAVPAAESNTAEPAKE